jgi:quercetin dioxygenase-like cupin family protein
VSERAISLGPGKGEAFRNPVGGPVTIKARGRQTGGALTVFESVPAPGEGPPLHLHAREDEILYVLEGHLRIRLEDEVSEAPAGAFVFIPRGLPHTWQNAGEGPAHVLFALAPAAPGMERFFERAAGVADDTPLADAFAQFAADGGMEVLGPPLAQSDPMS